MYIHCIRLGESVGASVDCAILATSATAWGRQKNRKRWMAAEVRHLYSWGIDVVDVGDRRCGDTDEGRDSGDAGQTRSSSRHGGSRRYPAEDVEESGAGRRG